MLTSLANLHPHDSKNAFSAPNPSHQPRLKFTDFFCGIGGFHVAATNLDMQCVFASDIDKYAQDAYEENNKVDIRAKLS